MIQAIPGKDVFDGGTRPPVPPGERASLVWLATDDNAARGSLGTASPAVLPVWPLSPAPGPQRVNYATDPGSPGGSETKKHSTSLASGAPMAV